MALDKSRITKTDVALLRECGFDTSSSNILFSARAVARELVRLRVARRLDLRERLQLIVVSAATGAVATLLLEMVLR